MAKATTPGIRKKSWLLWKQNGLFLLQNKLSQFLESISTYKFIN